jgi:hypothetical protein
MIARSTNGLALGEILFVHFVAFKSCRCKFPCRCSCILDAVLMLLYRLIQVRLRLCNVSKFRGGGLHA